MGAISAPVTPNISSASLTKSVCKDTSKTKSVANLDNSCNLSDAKLQCNAIEKVETNICTRTNLTSTTPNEATTLSEKSKRVVSENISHVSVRCSTNSTPMVNVKSEPDTNENARRDLEEKANSNVTTCNTTSPVCSKTD